MKRSYFKISNNNVTTINISQCPPYVTLYIKLNKQTQSLFWVLPETRTEACWVRVVCMFDPIVKGWAFYFSPSRLSVAFAAPEIVWELWVANARLNVGSSVRGGGQRPVRRLLWKADPAATSLWPRRSTLSTPHHSPRVLKRHDVHGWKR